MVLCTTLRFIQYHGVAKEKKMCSFLFIQIIEISMEFATFTNLKNGLFSEALCPVSLGPLAVLLSSSV